jgi:spore germination protein KA
MVIVTALTAIATFVFPSFSLGSVMIVGRLALVILGSVLGFYGIIWGLMFMLIHVLTIRSFGVPFFSPFAPTSKRGLLDTLIRAPWWLQNLRPKFIGDTEPQKQDFNLRPGPTQGKGEDEIENRGKN